MLDRSDRNANSDVTSLSVFSGNLADVGYNLDCMAGSSLCYLAPSKSRKFEDVMLLFRKQYFEDETM